MAQVSANLKPRKRRGRLMRSAMIAFGFILAYVFVAYIFMPAWWNRDEKRHPSLEDIPNITYTKDGIPGDPLNVSLIGTKPDLVKAMLAAQWHPADSLSLKSCLEIAAATILERSYADAPVSSLYLFGRKEDLAFEQPVGNDPKKRHHVRFWQTNQTDSNDRPVWIGSGTYDKRVGLSGTTGQITHHIDEDVDTERDHVIQSLKMSGDLLESYMVDGFHKTLTGRNGGGDLWKTDGKLSCGVIAIKQSP